jgi:hypothetical protein
MTFTYEESLNYAFKDIFYDFFLTKNMIFRRFLVLK